MKGLSMVEGFELTQLSQEAGTISSGILRLEALPRGTGSARKQRVCFITLSPGRRREEGRRGYVATLIDVHLNWSLMDWTLLPLASPWISESSIEGSLTAKHLNNKGLSGDL